MYMQLSVAHVFVSLAKISFFAAKGDEYGDSLLIALETTNTHTDDFAVESFMALGATKIGRFPTRPARPERARRHEVGKPQSYIERKGDDRDREETERRLLKTHE